MLETAVVPILEQTISEQEVKIGLIGCKYKGRGSLLLALQFCRVSPVSGDTVSYRTTLYCNTMP
jgi:hypothetical protein